MEHMCQVSWESKNSWSSSDSIDLNIVITQDKDMDTQRVATISEYNEIDTDVVDNGSYISLSYTSWQTFHNVCTHVYFQPSSPEAISATSNMNLVHWLLTGGLLHLVQRGVLGGATAHPGPSSLHQM